MSEDAVYVGLRVSQPDYGHGGPLVVGVIAGNTKRTLAPPMTPTAAEVTFEPSRPAAG